MCAVDSSMSSWILLRKSIPACLSAYLYMCVRSHIASKACGLHACSVPLLQQARIYRQQIGICILAQERCTNVPRLGLKLLLHRCNILLRMLSSGKSKLHAGSLPTPAGSKPAPALSRPTSAPSLRGAGHRQPKTPLGLKLPLPTETRIRPGQWMTASAKACH